MKKTTESINPATLNIDKLSIDGILKIINKEDASLSKIIKQHLLEIEKVIEKVVKSFDNNGRLFYVGCGSSGRLGVLDAAECPPTFSVPNELVQGIIAGGYKALYKSIEGAEDSFKRGYDDMQIKKITQNDIVIGISASGSANYVLGALKGSKNNGAYTVLLTFNNIKKEKFIDNIISIVVGPEIITGSTRMKSGTATKMILNMISTVSMIKINKTYKNFMVDLKISNKKLLDRGKRIISDVTGLSYNKSAALLKSAKNNVKVAILMEDKNINYNTAIKIINSHNGNLREALK